MRMRVEELHQELAGMIHRLYRSPEFSVYNSLPITLARAKVVRLHRFHFSRTRRDCWASVQCTAPIDVKRLIWEHEKDELNPPPALGGHNYWSSLHKVMKITGLGEEGVEKADLIPGCKAALRAWLHLARHSCWLTAFAGTAIQEKVKEGEGGVRESQRYTDEVRKLLEEGAPGKGFQEEPSDIVEKVLERYAVTEEARRDILAGVGDSLDFNRAFIGALVAVLQDIRE